MRFWTLLVLILTLVSVAFYESDLFEKVSWSPFGNTMEPKFYSDDDPGIRETKVIDNNNQPVWGTVNYGKLSDLKTSVTDGNGVNGIQMGEAPPMIDMKENAKVKSQFKPSPNGLNIHVLPGVQSDGSVLNSFVFDLPSGQNLIAPRNYYLSSSKVIAHYTKHGVITDDAKKIPDNPLANPIKQKKLSPIDISVFQVPFNDESFLSDSTGVVVKPSESKKATMEIQKTLNDLRRLGADNANSGELSKLIFKDGALTSDFNSINNLINNGAYAESYKYGLAVALGQKDNNTRLLPAVLIKSDLSNQDVYAQFDHLYSYMVEGKGKGVYSDSLVKWAKKNADSVLNLMMVNYMLQSQFTGTLSHYATPIYMSKWKENELSFHQDLIQKGVQSKEPFYLYASIDPKVAKIKGGDKRTAPTIPVKYVHLDLSYIFSLYSAIHAQVWVGSDSLGFTGSYSEVFEDSVSSMKKSIKSDKTELRKNGPVDAKKVSSTKSHFEKNNLVSGLSSAKNRKDRTEEVYISKEIIGALRLIMPAGENKKSKKELKLNGITYPITAVSKTKYGDSSSYSSLYAHFTSSGADSYSKWKNLVLGAQKMPLHPAIFNSHWGNNQSAYIMMPIMIGGVQFPDVVNIMLDGMMKDKDEVSTIENLSLANRYIMAFNFTSVRAEKTDNSMGVVRVEAGAKMGSHYDKKDPIILTGYNGGESFSITEYFKVQDAVSRKQTSPPTVVKNAKGTPINMEYLNLFKDFFSVDKLDDLANDGITFGPSFSKDSYIKNYDSSVLISPNYSTFFNSSEETQ